MKAYGYLSEKIETTENFNAAEHCASRRKKRRKEVVKFNADKKGNIERLLSSYINESYVVSKYNYKIIFEPKERFLSMLPYPDHVFHWGLLLESEYLIDRGLVDSTYASIVNRGQHLMVHDISNDIYNAGDKITHYLVIDASKMYANIPLSLVKRNLRRKIKDPKLLRAFDRIIESSIGTPMGNPDASEPTGVPIGLKMSTIIANVAFLHFDHECMRCFGITPSTAIAEFWAGEYISQCILSARTADDMEELGKGVEYLKNKFYSYLIDGIPYYYRFMDNVVVLHNDRVFLHILLDWAGLFMAGEMKMTLNPKWNVGSLIDGLNILGYRIFSDSHIRAQRKGKTKLVKKIRKGHSMGLTDMQIRIALSSQLGQMTHANSINFFRKYNMETKRERLGDKINRRKSQCPFTGISHNAQRKFESLLFKPESGEDENDYLIELTDYDVIASIKEFNDDGSPKPCLAIRYVWNGATKKTTSGSGKEQEMVKGQEYYSYTGSKILIEQAQQEFTKEDLPAATVITIETNKRNKTFYKFT